MILEIEFLELKEKYIEFLKRSGFIPKGKGMFKKINEIYFYTKLQINPKSNTENNLSFSLSFGIITEICSKVFSQKIENKIIMNDSIYLLDAVSILDRSFYYSLNLNKEQNIKTTTIVLKDLRDILAKLSTLDSLQKIKNYIYNVSSDFILVSIILLDCLMQNQFSSEDKLILEKNKLLFTDYWSEKFNWVIDNDENLKQKLGSFRF